MNHRKVKPGSKIRIYLDTYSAAGASASASALALADILVYKNDSMVQRASTAGFVLLDTDGIDLDGQTGVVGIEINLADDTDAGFFQNGNDYRVTIAPFTVDSQTVHCTPQTFTIGYDGAFIDGVITAITSQSIFDINVGPVEDGALDGSQVIIHDKASAVQLTSNSIALWIGATLTINLDQAPTFTIAVGDNISIFPSGGNHYHQESGAAILTKIELMIDGIAPTYFWRDSALQAMLDVLGMASGNLDAQLAGLSSLQNNTRATLGVPTFIQNVDVGTATVKIRLHLYDEAGNMEAPDNTPTIALTDAAGNSLTSRLSAATNPSTGVYLWDYTDTAGDDHEQIMWVFSVLEGGQTRTYPFVTQIVSPGGAGGGDATQANQTLILSRLPAALSEDGYMQSDLQTVLESVPATGVIRFNIIDSSYVRKGVLYTIKSDGYDDDLGTAIEFQSDDFPDLTLYDSATLYLYNKTEQNLNVALPSITPLDNATKKIKFEATAAQMGFAGNSKDYWYALKLIEAQGPTTVARGKHVHDADVTA